jgi:hypothetical protein
MATVVHSAAEKGLVLQDEKRTHLTPNGLLMEGDYTPEPGPPSLANPNLKSTIQFCILTSPFRRPPSDLIYNLI